MNGKVHCKKNPLPRDKGLKKTLQKNSSRLPPDFCMKYKGVLILSLWNYKNAHTKTVSLGDQHKRLLVRAARQSYLYSNMIKKMCIIKPAAGKDVVQI